MKDKSHLITDLAQHFDRIKNRFNITENLFSPLIKRWREPHRFYHDLDHLIYLYSEIVELYKENQITSEEQDKLIIIALYHDAIYDPASKTNEEDSAMLYLNQMGGGVQDDIYEAIIDSKHKFPPRTKLSQMFCDLDLKQLYADFDVIHENEKKIFKEFQQFPYKEYRQGRIDFLTTINKKICNPAIDTLIQLVRDRKPNIGLYAGSFNPFHIGHYHVLIEAERIFDKVIILKGKNPDKDGYAFSRESFAPILQYRQIESYTGLLTDYIKQNSEFCNITLIKGIRDDKDLAHEMKQIRFMKEMYDDHLRIVFIPTNPNVNHVSSSDIRMLQKIDPKLAEQYLNF